MLQTAYEPPPFTLAAPIVIQIDGPPKGKGRPRFVRKTGVAYTPASTRLYEKAIRNAAGHAMGNRMPVTGPVYMAVYAFLPVPASWTKAKRESALSGLLKPTGRPDLDNLWKAAADALNGVVYNDDSQVVRTIVEKRYSDRPRLRIEIEGRL